MARNTSGPLQLNDMDRPLLRDIEDRTLAMAEKEYITFKTVRVVLGTYYGRNVSFDEIASIAGRLSNLGFLRWMIRESGHFRFCRHAPVPLQHAAATLFTASALGLAHLALPRHVA